MPLLGVLPRLALLEHVGARPPNDVSNLQVRMRTLEHQPCQHAAVHGASLAFERIPLLAYSTLYSGTIDEPIYCQG